ncbi:Polysaccharide deacetylase [Pseudomonas cannabina]|uniref:Polysaccharide deacetylase n=1 Tax=Pseudomonas cannabina TaxID=86840 RepID=A0A3M3M4E1_PSECA|nr:Polysaccharide deacetylase [Pseudomonas cannabina]
MLRPPFWNYDKRTFSAYQRHDLKVLLTDLSANDGKIWGYNFSLRRRSNMVSQLSQVRERIAAGELPVVDGVIPVVVTFHDLNRYTARHTQEYVQILVDSAAQTGVRLAAKPFYDDSALPWPERSKMPTSLFAYPACGTGSGTTTLTDGQSSQGVFAHLTALNNHRQLLALAHQAVDIAERIAIHHQQVGNGARSDAPQFTFALQNLCGNAGGTAQRRQITQQFCTNSQLMGLILVHFSQQV